MRFAPVPPHAPFWSAEIAERLQAALAPMRDDLISEHPNFAVDVQAASGRPCGDCTLCCKLISVNEIKKPQGHWCPHCNPKAGCRIYDERPNGCRVFVCGWAAGEGAPEMKPSTSHCIFDYDMWRENGASRRIMRVHVDPHYRDAWREGAVANHIRLHHALGTTVIVLIQNGQTPCPAFGIPGKGEAGGVVLDPVTGKPWCDLKLENLP